MRCVPRAKIEVASPGRKKSSSRSLWLERVRTPDKKSRGPAAVVGPPAVTSRRARERMRAMGGGDTGPAAWKPRGAVT